MKKEQLGELILASEDTLYHVAKTLLLSDADCKDAIQEAIVKAFSSLHTLRQDSYAKTWLVRILINECYTLIRRQKRTVSLEEYQCQEVLREDADYSDLYEAVLHLPADTRICVILRLARARTKMRRELEQAAT